MAIILTNTYAISYSFIDEKFAKIICQVLITKPQRLMKLKLIQKFDSRAANSISHAIYPILIVGTYTESLPPLLIIKLRNYLIILSQL